MIEGTGPRAVADYIRRASHQARLSAAQMGRRRLVLGCQSAAVAQAIRARYETPIDEANRRLDALETTR